MFGPRSQSVESSRARARFGRRAERIDAGGSRAQASALVLPLLLVFAIGAGPASGQPSPREETPEGDASATAARRPPPARGQEPVVDGASGIAIQLLRRTGGRLGELDLTAPPERLRPPLQSDLPRLRRAGVAAVSLLIHPPSSPGSRSALARGLEQLDVARRLADRYPGDFAIARYADDVHAAFQGGRVALLATWAHGEALEGSLGALRALEVLGVSAVSLDGVGTFERTGDGGLTARGQAAVTEASRLGLAIDLAGARPRTRADVLDAAPAPVIFTGVGARALHDHPHNLDDDTLAALARNGGVALVPLSPLVLSEPARAHAEREWEAFVASAQRHKGDRRKVTADLSAWRKKHPRPEVRLARVVEHLKALRDRAGIEHVGVATGFDALPEGPIGAFLPEGPIGSEQLPEGPIGLQQLPEGPIGVLDPSWPRGLSGRYTLADAPDVSALPALWRALEAAGFTRGEIARIQGDNLLRALREARRVGRRLNEHRAPAEERRLRSDP